MNCYVLIPAYCPDRQMLKLIGEVQSPDTKCLIVNDGSSEEYDDLFHEAEQTAVVLRHPENRGKGAALKTGMRYILASEERCVVVCADADGQHLPEDIRKCAAAAAEQPDAFVIGVRNFHQDSVPFRSLFGNKITEAVFALTTGRHIKDTQSGLRAFSSDLIPLLLRAEGERYEYEMNQLYLITSSRIPVIQTEIRTVYEEKNASSHFNPIRDSFLIYRSIILFAVSSLTAFLLDTSLFWCFSRIFPGTLSFLKANILARVFSALFNYEFNRSHVFGDQSSRTNSFLKYVILAAGILCANSLILWILIQKLRLPALAAKILTEALMFMISWIIQNRFVFAGKKSEVIPS